MNAAEDLLAVHLKELGLHFIRDFRYVPGRKFEADFAVWTGPPLYDHRFALIEVTGGIWQRKSHGSVSGVLKDNERLLEAFKAGWPMIRFTPDQVKSGEAKTAIEAVK
jgi:hypothetical protein